MLVPVGFVLLIYVIVRISVAIQKPTEWEIRQNQIDVAEFKFKHKIK